MSPLLLPPLLPAATPDLVVSPPTCPLCPLCSRRLPLTSLSLCIYIYDLHVLLTKNTTFVCGMCSGVILFEETLYQNASDGTPFVKLLQSKGVIPGIKVWGACEGRGWRSKQGGRGARGAHLAAGQGLAGS